ncbi:hypothetical protein FZEAL_10149 [Fusarium zealandicum]|uniref:F-box domain-containing protein n=1 Tax=Fusarium zealandicum TaxID=1053134 RepID=A0A8H4U5A4_9HYPO|nr:hypothetical protein FZEAL_10149 [Fusarium zealandicum]
MSTTMDPLSQLPLHVISQVLEHLDTIQQLGVIILSHRVFYSALKDSPQSIASSILIRQVPRAVLPFSIALLKSTQINKRDVNALTQVLSNLEAAILVSTDTIASLSKLSLSDYAFLSRAYAAVDSLRTSMFEQIVPLINECGLNHSTTLSPDESFRLDRAFIRYQIMCNLFCYPPGVITSSHQDELQILRCRFFSVFSPWVNEQLVCVYAYLRRSVGDAFDQLGAHDVEWGQLPIQWGLDVNQTPRVQWFFKALSCPLDGSQDSTQSGPGRMWLQTHSEQSFFQSVWGPIDDNLWDRAYVIWDSQNITDSRLREISERLRHQPTSFPAYKRTWSKGDIRQSELQRADIYLVGGRGYWPQKSIDFTHVHGLTEEGKRWMTEKWRKESEYQKGKALGM